MGQAKEQEVRLMGLGFLMLAIVASLVLIVAAVRIGGELRSQSTTAGVATQSGAPLGFDGLQSR
ncbi:MAG TPA: hypothetical protein VFP56_08260 [Candidatus Limnocylindrales bacterium]|nr:hypothetical protein [Candidatus Limnocylindrales bacterium]